MINIKNLNTKNDVENLTNDEMYDIYDQLKENDFNNVEVYKEFKRQIGLRGILT